MEAGETFDKQREGKESEKQTSEGSRVGRKEEKVTLTISLI